MIKFVYPLILYLGIPVTLFLIWFRIFRFQPVSYQYPLANFLYQKLGISHLWVRAVMLFLRALTLLTLVILAAKPQWVDTRSRIEVEGVPIAIVLDVSGSMLCIDDLNDPTPRIDVAKREAIRFIGKRVDDPIALIVFGKVAVSRVPLTMDKALLRDVIEQTNLGVIDPDGTVLSKAMMLGVARLKESQAKNKIMILLTDGQPTPGLDIPPKAPVEAARQLGIKIYTIGIGSDIAYAMHPDLGQFVQVPSQLNKELLAAIAQATGGQFFEARNPEQLRRIYDHIDQLEKTKIETPLYQNLYDWFVPLVWFCIFCMLVELALALRWSVL